MCWCWCNMEFGIGVKEAVDKLEEKKHSEEIEKEKNENKEN